MKVTGTQSVRWAPQDGRPGTGVTITNTATKYAQSNSGTVRPTQGWQDTIPTVANGNYLWTWVRVEYSDGNFTNSYSVGRMGEDGKGIQSTTVTYSKQSSSSVDPTSITDWGPYPTNLQEGDWLYVKTHIVYTGTPQTSTDSYSVSRIGIGAYYTGAEEYYEHGASDSDIPSGYIVPGTYPQGSLSQTTWSQNRPTLDNSTPYLWNQEISHDSQGNSYVMPPICIGNFAKGLSSIAETYTISSHDNEADMLADTTERTANPWTDNQQNAKPTEAKPYQWNKTVISYNKGADTTLYHISAVRGADGKNTIRLDLSNEMDSMVYNESGTLISGSISSIARLYDGGTEITTGVTYEISSRSGCTSSQATISGQTVTVTGINSSGYVIVRASYNGQYYYATLSLKKMIGSDKYELQVVPDAVTYNSTTGEKSATTIEAKVYKIYQNASGGISRDLVASLPSGMTLEVDGTAVTGYSSGKTFNIDFTRSSHQITLKSGNNILDAETVPISETENGASITGPKGNDAKSIYKVAFEKPSTPTGNSPTGWSESLPSVDDTEIQHVGDWIPLMDGWHRAPKIGDGSYTEHRLQFTTTKENQTIYIEIESLSESNYDFCCIGNLDANAPHNSSDNYKLRQSGGSSSSPQRGVCEFVVSTPGAHSIGISFFKDSSVTVEGEYAKFRVGKPTVWQSEVLTWNGDNVGTWSEPATFANPDYKMRTESPKSNLLDMTSFPSLNQMGLKWSARNGSIVTGDYNGNNSFHATNDSTTSDNDFLRQDVYRSGSVTKLQPNKWYTLSFVCRGSGTLNTYFYPAASGHINTSAGMVIDGVFQATAPTDLVVSQTLTSAWQKHTITFKTSDGFSGEVMFLFRLWRGAGGSVWVACPKLEQCTMATGYVVSDYDAASMVVGESGFPNERGVYNPLYTYSWDDQKRDYVYYKPADDTQYYAYFVRQKGATIPINTPPSANGDSNWEKGSSVSTLLANTIIGAACNIGGFLMSDSIMKSANERVILDGVNNLIKVLNAAKDTIIAAMGNVDYPFFAGGNSGANAAWNVDNEGNMKASKGRFGNLIISGTNGENFQAEDGKLRFVNNTCYTWITTDTAQLGYGKANIAAYNDQGGNCIVVTVPAGTTGDPAAIWAIGSVAMQADGMIKCSGAIRGDKIIQPHSFVSINVTYQRQDFANSQIANRVFGYASETGKGLYLPSLTQMRNALKITSTSEGFVFRMIIIGGLNTSQWTLRGREASGYGTYSTGEYPLMIDNNQSVFRTCGVDRCDTFEFLLVYDPSADSDYKYTARKVIILE